MLSKNASPEFIDHIRQILGVKVVQSQTKYLGLPTVVSRCRSQTMQGIIDKMRNKTGSWQSVMLSQGGRQVLIQTVLQAIPQYWLSCFLLPDKVIKQIHSMITNFWWCHSGKTKGVHRTKGDTLRLPKDEGGLGFYNFKFFSILTRTRAPLSIWPVRNWDRNTDAGFVLGTGKLLLKMMILSSPFWDVITWSAKLCA
ncbi:hypothetical protein QQ045_022507 [Rhodiola kirilowii]